MSVQQQNEGVRRAALLRFLNQPCGPSHIAPLQSDARKTGESYRVIGLQSHNRFVYFTTGRQLA